MQRIRSSIICARILGLAAVMAVSASPAGQQFSAEMLQRGPDGKSTTGKMVVGDGRIRTEVAHQGQDVVRITDEKRGVEWILFPDQKKYMEHRLGGPGGQPMEKPSVEDPCAGMPGLTCRKVGDELVAERAAVVWEVVVNQQGQTMKGTQWIDKERGPSFLLRQELPSGQKMERSLVGQESLGGRQTEKWRIDMTGPDGQTVSTFEWYDPDLELAVRQEFPGGMVSELANIRVGAQPDRLFGIPAGYERMSAPRGMPVQPPQP